MVSSVEEGLREQIFGMRKSEMAHLASSDPRVSVDVGSLEAETVVVDDSVRLKALE